MKKLTKILFIAGGTLLLGAGSVLSYLQARPAEPLSDLTLANLDAMAEPPDDEIGGSGPCDNFNGYRVIKEGDLRVYDCCYVVVIGRGTKDCKRW